MLTHFLQQDLNEKRIIRAYYDVRILKNDMRGRSDSLHLDRLAGLTKLLRKPLTRKQEQIFTEVDKINQIQSFGSIKVKCQEITFF